MLPTTNSYYSATNPHSLSHRRPRVTTIDRGREKRPPAPSETRQGGIHRAVVRSLALAIGRRARARSMPQGTHPGPGRQRCCPPLPPASAEPCLPRPVPSGLYHCTPHSRQEFREPPCPPPLPNGHDNANNQRSVNAARDPSPEDDRSLATKSALLSSLPPRAGGCVRGAEHQRPVAPVIAQPLGQVPPHGRPLSS
jgi:hypothetical protein